MLVNCPMLVVGIMAVKNRAPSTVVNIVYIKTKLH